MSWRTVVISNHCKLDYSMGHMVVRSVEQTTKVHLDEISVLVIETTACSITAALMNELTKNKVKVIFCDEKHNPSHELIPYYGSHDCSLKLKLQIAWNLDAKSMVWTAIVAEKIKNQSLLLKALELDQYTLLESYIEELELNDQTNREGHAAKVYFNALFGKDFSRSGDNSVNAMLNFGYSLLLSVFNREVVAGGYVTQLGLFHDNRFNPFNLSCDLMEPFRPFVDAVVVRTNPTCFEKNEKRKLYDLLNREIMVDRRKNTLLNAIKIYCKSVFDAVEKQDLSLIRFPDFAYEL